MPHPLRSTSETATRAVMSLGLLALAGALAPSAVAQSLTLNNATAILSGKGTSVGGDYAFGSGADATTTSYATADTYNGSALSLQNGASITSLNFHDSSDVYVNGGSVTSIGTDPPYVGPSYGNVSVTGGTVGSLSLGTGTASISGGTVGDVSAIYGGSVNVSGGSAGNVTLDQQDGTGSFGTATVTGGSLTSLTSNGAAVTVSGGAIGGLTLGVGHGTDDFPFNSSGTVSGGTFNTLTAYGGQFTDPVVGIPVNYYTTGTVSGGTFKFLDTSFYGGFDLTGTGLKLSSQGVVTGFLTDGQAVDAKYTNSDGLGFLEFNGKTASPVPEASSVVSFGLLLALGGLATAAWRKKASA